jgi:hypothetical protein
MDQTTIEFEREHNPFVLQWQEHLQRKEERA